MWFHRKGGAELRRMRVFVVGMNAGLTWTFSQVSSCCGRHCCPLPLAHPPYRAYTVVARGISWFSIPGFLSGDGKVPPQLQPSNSAPNKVLLSPHGRKVHMCIKYQYRSPIGQVAIICKYGTKKASFFPIRRRIY